MRRKPLNLEALESRLTPSVSVVQNGGILSVAISAETVAHAVQFLPTPVAGQVNLVVDGSSTLYSGVTQETYSDQQIPGVYGNSAGDFVYNGVTTIPLSATMRSEGSRAISLAANSSLTGMADFTTLQDFATGNTITDTGSYNDTILAGKNNSITIGPGGGGNEVYATATGTPVTVASHVGQDILMVNAANAFSDASAANDIYAPFFPTGAAAGSGGFVATPDAAHPGDVTIFFAAPAGTTTFAATLSGPNELFNWTDSQGTFTQSFPRDTVEFFTVFGGVSGTLSATNYTYTSDAMYGDTTGGNVLTVGGQGEPAPAFALFKMIAPGGNTVNAGADFRNDVYTGTQASTAPNTVNYGPLFAATGAFNEFHDQVAAQNQVNTVTGFVPGRDVYAGASANPPASFVSLDDATLIAALLSVEQSMG